MENIFFETIDLSGEEFIEYNCIPNSKTLENLSFINLFVGKNNSGKSRFLRKLFSTKKLRFSTPVIKIKLLDELIVNFKSEFDRERITKSHGRFFDDIADGLHRVSPFSFASKVIDFEYLLNFLNTFSNKYKHVNIIGRSYEENAFRVFDRYHSLIKEIIPTKSTVLDLDFESIYIPTLRGLRPLQLSIGEKIRFTNEKDNYKERTRADYFQNDKMQIYTGISLYNDLKEYTHGTPAQRNQVKEFQLFLSKTFFESAEVELVPRHNMDVPFVRIGNNEEPIFNLGDGIQSLIILTYPLFFNSDKCLKVFIEEPEVNLHPGFQRVFLKTLANPLFKNFQFFLTTHSNHFLDFSIDTKGISIYKFEKELNELNNSFGIMNVENGDSGVLSTLGVRNSSVFLSNCTIWVEGITDRIYIRKYLEVAQREKGTNYLEDIHYSFVEYSGSNITHWSFLEDADKMHKNILVERVCGKLFLIVDNDEINYSGDSAKKERYKRLESNLKGRFYLLKVREIENLLAPNILQKTVGKLEKNDYTTTDIDFEDYKNEYLGKFIENKFHPLSRKYTSASGSLNNKVEFAKIAASEITTWNDLTFEAKDLIEKICEFIKQQN